MPADERNSGPPCLEKVGLPTRGPMAALNSKAERSLVDLQFFFYGFDVVSQP